MAKTGGIGATRRSHLLYAARHRVRQLFFATSVVYRSTGTPTSILGTTV